MICDQWDVVVVPFPFSEKAGTKRRPAVVLTASAFNEHGHTVLAMITTKTHRPWPSDPEIEEHAAAGLHGSCIVRLKTFTLDNRLILKRIGSFPPNDRQKVSERLRQYLL